MSSSTLPQPIVSSFQIFLKDTPNSSSICVRVDSGGVRCECDSIQHGRKENVICAHIQYVMEHCSFTCSGKTIQQLIQE